MQIILAAAVERNTMIEALEVASALLHYDKDRDVLIKKPRAYEKRYPSTGEPYVLTFKKAIYVIFLACYFK